jgi:hypothetical protein
VVSRRVCTSCSALGRTLIAPWSGSTGCTPNGTGPPWRQAVRSGAPLDSPSRAGRLARLTQAAEELSHVGYQPVGCLKRGKVAACVDITPMDDVVALLGITAYGNGLGKTATPVGTCEGVGQSCPCTAS